MLQEGPILKEKDLIKSLHRNIIAGAALDVFEYEPIKKQNSLKKVPNCILEVTMPLILLMKLKE